MEESATGIEFDTIQFAPYNLGMTTMTDLFSEKPRLRFNQLDSTRLSPDKIWADYDELTDSIVFFFTGQPIGTISVDLDENLHAMVDPKSKDVVGIHIEAFENKFLVKYPLLQTSWPYVKGSLSAVVNTVQNSLMKIFSFGVAFMIGENGQSVLKAA